MFKKVWEYLKIWDKPKVDFRQSELFQVSQNQLDSNPTWTLDKENACRRMFHDVYVPMTDEEFNKLKLAFNTPIFLGKEHGLLYSEKSDILTVYSEDSWEMQEQRMGIWSSKS